MSTAKILSAIPYGYTGRPITVEGDLNQGLPTFNIIGMPGRSIFESRDRIRSALLNTGFNFPKSKIIINLAPAELNKSGSYLDLPIALCILRLSKQLQIKNIDHNMFVGELALNGDIRPVKGIISIVECAKQHHIERLFLPAANSRQAQLVANDIQLIPVKSLRELWLHLKEIELLSPLKQNVKITQTDKHIHYLDEIVGQNLAKRALIIACAGRHNILLSGPPGTGKSSLAQVAPFLLPPPSLEECIEITKLHSLSRSTTSINTTNDNLTLVANTRPFRSPHHSASSSAILGGGAMVAPGEISLAHRGILFLDELPEYSRDILESLRQPLEDRKITVSRANSKATFPADFMLIATMNPCPCGYLGSPDHECKCSPGDLASYRKKLSGPLMDRIDISVSVQNQDNSVLLKNTTLSTRQHASAKQQIEHALNTQFIRYGSKTTTNANLPSSKIAELMPLDSGATEVLNSASTNLKLSARSYFRCIRVARTIADLESTPPALITRDHIYEALQYRQVEPHDYRN